MLIAPLPTAAKAAADRAREFDRAHPERETLLLAAAGAAKVLGARHSATRAFAKASITMAKVDLWHAPLSKQQDIRSRFFQRRSCKTVRQGLALPRSCDKCHQDYTCLAQQNYAG